MSEIKVKPCPFCGGEAIFINKTALWKDWTSVMCIKCKSQINFFGGDKKQEEAAEAWNRRSSENG